MVPGPQSDPVGVWTFVLPVPVMSDSETLESVGPGPPVALTLRGTPPRPSGCRFRSTSSVVLLSVVDRSPTALGSWKSPSRTTVLGPTSDFTPFSPPTIELHSPESFFVVNSARVTECGH